MISHLIIKNLALIESAEISFIKGLNILTGETGAGKTIILTALGFILGKRVQPSLVRQGAEKAVVEASFDLPPHSPIFPLLDEAGISYALDEPLTLRREISCEGKSRAQINSQTIPLSLLQTLSALLCDLVDQSSHQELREPENQRNLLDLYGDIDLRAFSNALGDENAHRQELAELQSLCSKKEIELEFAVRELETLEEAKLEDEEALFEEYKSLAGRKELLEKIYALHTALCDAPQAILAQLNRLKAPLEGIAKIEKALGESALSLYQVSLIALNELSELLDDSLNSKEADPKRLLYLDEQVSKIHHVKRKMGISTPEEGKKLAESLRAKIAKLTSLDREITTLTEKLTALEKTTNNLAQKLTAKRKSAAEDWQERITEALRTLNMPDATITILLEKIARNAHGDDKVTFWIHANKGEANVPVQLCASGGELSRLFLCMKRTLAEKNRTPILVFDEIDANVGGQTATMIGKTLQELAQVRQVICVTHFPQVATFADKHHRIQKSEKAGRTTTTIDALTDAERERELLRMLGG